MNLLEVRDLSVKMGLQSILHGVSIDVGEASIVTVLGANGVGKTTLMRTISGVYQSSGGAIRFDGVDITAEPSHRIVARGLAQAPEGRQIFSNMTVRENLALGAGRRRAAETAPDLDRVMKLFPVLKDRYEQKAGSLSGGEQQMLCVGRALMARPKLLLMDEPSLGLAPKLVKQIFDLVVAIRDAGTSILLVEQNARAALRIADHAYVMDAGKIALSGPARKLAADERVHAAYLGGHVA